MRTCQSCGLENPDDRDFCDCGEYLRWDPTGFVQAVTPEMAAAAAAEAPQPAAPPPNAARGGTLVQGAVPAPPPPPAAAEPEKPAMASITLKLPDEDPVHEHVLALGVDPGGRERIQAVVRNQSGIVDN